MVLNAVEVAGVVSACYFLLVNCSYVVFLSIAAVEFARDSRLKPFLAVDELYSGPLTTAVSVLMPAHNEEAGIVDAVRAMLALRYPVFEVVVIDDGSTDETFARLEAEFQLVCLPAVVSDELPQRGVVRSVHVPAIRAIPLVVVRQDNGGKTRALNTGLCLARHPLVCMVDADSILDPDALMRVARPFLDDPFRVVAAGGAVRVANGCRVVAGRLVDVRMPRSLLPAIQAVEYLRVFLLGRTAWSRFNGLLVISGAFGLFRRDAVVAVGGLDPGCMSEDAELVLRIHRWMREKGQDYRIVFVAEPVSWTEVPETGLVLGRQRRRWHRGLTEILLKHRRMIGNPRYGVVGLFTLPYHVLFELITPLVEFMAVLVLVLGLATGAVTWSFAVSLSATAYGFAFLISAFALTVEEYSFRRYHRWADLGIALVAAFAENIGYRQRTARWRMWGGWAALRRSERTWGVMTRRGFDVPTSRGGKPT
ncbi:glycosyltransferase family 2 protein [Lentzea nigeriaca]|uniref:glycosyltransferase family 2 protein n=1 Tax=Lentzea nigeriaca TaxID=1128665 RepID=UPI00195A93D1|nr:glycosyltransferase [Lentzea nigeriaca]MBM7859127.1 cellulose synthase/poly-beta-1,6-N-acetylglucosamine synthase-like glycosyltransferase [Lentzea nigeriaca]